jgi:hypothetical protein
VAVPLDFMRVPLITLVGWWLYGERPDAFVFLGVLESHSVCCGIFTPRRRGRPVAQNETTIVLLAGGGGAPQR